MNKYITNIKYCIKVIMYKHDHNNLTIDVKYKYKGFLTINIMCPSESWNHVIS